MRVLTHPSDMIVVLTRHGLALQISFDIRLMDQLLPSVAECDTIFAASSSEHVLLSKADVRPQL